MTKAFACFHRTWWAPNPEWPDGREPQPGAKIVIARNIPTEDEARRICADWNRAHAEGPMADRAEYEAQEVWGRKVRKP